MGFNSAFKKLIMFSVADDAWNAIVGM